VKTFLQNLPTLVMVQNGIYEDHLREGQNTKAKEILEKVKKLRDPRFLLRLVGLGQIMETFCEVSLEGQYSDDLPSEVWDSVVQNKAEPELLADNWT
jgi:predicted amino acid racemase